MAATLELKNTFPSGVLLSPQDNRDYTINPAMLAAIPDTWKRARKPKHANQGLTGGCTGYGGGYAYEAHYGIPFSKEWLYGDREESHWMGVGRYMHELLDTMHKRGALPNVDFSLSREYPDNESPWLITNCLVWRDNLRPKAEKYKLKSYARIHTATEIKTAIMNGLEVLAAIPISDTETDARGVLHYDQAGFIGYHCVWICDWAKDYPEEFNIDNSWDENFGIDGYFYTNAERLLMTDNCWALEFADADKPVEPTKPSVIRRTLRLNTPYMKGADVLEAQVKLVAHGFPVGVLDGIFGKQCVAATQSFQRSKGLTADGILGPKTWVELDKLPAPIPVTKIDRFISWLKEQVGMIYVWGAQGQVVTSEQWIKDCETSVTNANRAITLYRKCKAEGVNPIYAYDCSGVIMAWLIMNKLSKYDMSSRGLYDVCEKITREQLKRGDLVFRYGLSSGKIQIHHVGIYIGDGLVIEAKGRDDGVVMRDINASGSSYWNRYGQMPQLQEA